MFSFKLWLESLIQDHPDPYVVFDLPKTASDDEIKQKFRKLSMLYHPDRGGNDKSMQIINKAFEKIKDPYKNFEPSHQSSSYSPPPPPPPKKNFSSIFDARNKMIDYTPGQKKALLDIQKLIDGHKSGYYLLSGYAGTGKTTLAENIARYSLSKGRKVRIMAPTNKAALVLFKKLQEANITIDKDNIGTIHKIIYGEPNAKGDWEPQREIRNSVIIIDESSMIEKSLMRDLIEATRTNNILIFMGDSYQLEPVGQDSGLFHGHVKEIGDNKTELTDVKRQTLDSNVLKIATLVRNDKKPYIPSESIENFKVCKTKQEFLDEYKKSLENNEDVAMIVATNQERMFMNQFARNVKYQGKQELLNDDDVLLSISNSVSHKNGETFKIESFKVLDKVRIRADIKMQKMLIDTFVYLCEVKITTTERKLPMVFLPNWDKPSFYGQYIWEAARHDPDLKQKLDKYGFIDYTPISNKPKFNTEAIIATYGYSITAHKSQGSQWEKVFVNQNFFSDKWDNSRWYYTAITRSAKDIVVLDSEQHEKIDVNQMENDIKKHTV